MKHIKFLSADKKTDISLSYWEPKTKVIGTLQIIHGMAEYIDRYDDFANYLTSLGYVVIGHNHLGHGGDAKIQGYFNVKNPVELILKDINFVNKWTDEKYPDVPHFIMGHSMGSFALRNYLQLYKPALAGAILMGTGASAPGLKTAKAISTTTNKMAPEKTNNWLNSIAFGSYSKKFPEDSEFNWLSKNQENVAAYEKDNNTGFIFTNNGFYTLFNLVSGATKKDWAQNIPDNLPFLIVSGELDPVGDFSKGPKQTSEDLTNAGVKNVDLKLFTGLRHEILFENEKLEVYKTISDWLSSIINN